MSSDFSYYKNGSSVIIQIWKEQRRLNDNSLNVFSYNMGNFRQRRLNTTVF